MADIKIKQHPVLKKLYDKYKLKGDFVNFIEVYLSQMYGQLLFNYAVGLVADDALDEFDAYLGDSSVDEEQKQAMLLKLIKDHSDVDLEEFYTHVVKIFVYHLDKNMTTIMKLYNKSIKESKTRSEMEAKFAEYMEALDDMKVRNLKKHLGTQNG